MDFVTLIDYVGTFAFAISGIRLAAAKNFDAFGAYVVGDRPIRPYEVDLGLVGFLFEHNNRQVEVSNGTAVFDHPAKAVAWLAERFTALGDPLKAGEMVMSGSAITMLQVKQGDHVRCRHGRFGEVSVNFV